MPEDGFGSGLWKNLRSVQFGKDGGIEAPIRASGRDGIVVGLDAIARTEQPRAEQPLSSSARSRRWWRLVRPKRP